VITDIALAPRYTLRVDGERGELVRRAASGDEAAWNGLIARYNSLVWSIVRSYRLSSDDAMDTVQIVWMRLVENLDRIREPEAIGTWLAITTRNQCMAHFRKTSQTPVPVDTTEHEVIDVKTAAPGEALMVLERNAAVWQALSRISQRCQQLLRILAATPPPSYQEISAALGVPIGSLGPTRARCLDKLREAISTDGHPNDDFS
jgi:RNA polymerase sigma factor (sigma-70 family)